MAVEVPKGGAGPLAFLALRRRPRVVDALGIALLVALCAWLLVNLVKDPAQFANVLLIGLTNGTLYGLVALGYTLVYGILQLINFAHGDVFALGGLLASTILLSVFGLDGTQGAGVVIAALVVALLVAAVFSLVLNAGIELVAYRRLRNAPRLAPLITAVGMSFILQNVGLLGWGVGFTTTPDLVSKHDIFNAGGVSYQWNKLAVVLITVPLLVLLSLLVTRTRQGKAMRATSQDPEAAAMMGINVNRTISFTFALAGALAGLAGVLYLVDFTVIRYDQGFQLGLIAFTAAVLGGIGNMVGAVVGAVVIGLIEAFNEGLSWGAPGSDWTRSIIFGVLILILVFRPEGILGERTPEGQ
jgi:branched-chain amino acid transport system permease protein